MKNLVEWCETQIEEMRKTTQLMQEGKLKTTVYENFQTIDSTESWIKEYQRQIAELEAIIASSK